MNQSPKFAKLVLATKHQMSEHVDNHNYIIPFISDGNRIIFALDQLPPNSNMHNANVAFIRALEYGRMQCQSSIDSSIIKQY